MSISHEINRIEMERRAQSKSQVVRISYKSVKYTKEHYILF